MSLNQIVWIEFDYMNQHFEGEAIPVVAASNPAFEIYFNNEYTGTVVKDSVDAAPGDYIDRNMLRIISSKLSSYF